MSKTRYTIYNETLGEFFEITKKQYQKMKDNYDIQEEKEDYEYLKDWTKLMYHGEMIGYYRTIE